MNRSARWAGAVALLAASHAAEAHGSVEGLGSFFGGLFHPVVEPAHLISMLALGLLLGQRGLRASHPALPCLALGAAAGVIAAGLGWGQATDTPLLLAAGLAGVTVAASLPLPVGALALLSALMGLGIGLGSAPESGTSTAQAVMLLGTLLGIVGWTADVALISFELKRRWLRIAIRVVGSWLSACAMLVLALWSVGRPMAAL